MKNTFPKYARHKGHGLTIKEAYESFSSEDKNTIQEYLQTLGAGAESTKKKYFSVITKICDVIGGDLKNITKEKFIKFSEVVAKSNLLPATKNEIKKSFKRFLKETYPDYSLRFGESTFKNHLKTEKDINFEKINPDTILKKNEIELLVRGAITKDKALIMLMYETAARPEEVTKLRWKDINLEEGSVNLLSSKTSNYRTNPIQNSILFLKQWKEAYPYPDVTKEDFVFPNAYYRNKHVTPACISARFRRLGEKVLSKSVWLYLLRHTRATELQKVLPPKVYEKFMDHSIATASRYEHLNKDDVREAMFKNVYSQKEISKEKKHELEKQVSFLKEELEQLKALVMKSHKGSVVTDIFGSYKPEDLTPAELLERQNKVLEAGFKTIKPLVKNSK